MPNDSSSPNVSLAGNYSFDVPETLESAVTRPKDITAGLVTSIVMIATTVSYSAAIFSGPLSRYLQIGIGYGLIGACVTAIIFAVGSGIPFAIAGPDSKPTAVLAALAASIAVTISHGSGAVRVAPEATAVIVLTALALAALLTGVVLYLCGRFRLGQWVRFVPYPVVGGFMAASGWLLAASAVRILTGVDLSWTNLGQMASVTRLEQLAMGIIFAGALVVAGRSRYIMAFPALLFGTAAAFHLVRAMGGTSLLQAQDAGWLLQTPTTGTLPVLWLAHHWEAFDYTVLLKQSGDFLALFVVTTVTLLLGVSSIEVEAHLRHDVDMDRELRLNGIANLAAGMLGGMVGTLSLSRTVFNYRNGARSRISGLIVAAGCILTLLLGATVLAYVPVLILGGMLLRLGSEMLEDWVIHGWKRMERVDYAQVIIILIVIVLWGFIAGVLVGVVAACVTFAVNTGRIGLIKQELDRTNYGSRVERPSNEVKELVRYGSSIQIIWLHGYVFFGSVNPLSQHVKQMAEQRAGGLRMAVLDFHEVLGIDSSAVLVLLRLRQIAERENFLLVLSGLNPRVEHLLTAAGLFQQEDGSRQNETCFVFPSLDAALEWCENRLLEERMTGEESRRTVDEWLAQEVGGEGSFRQLSTYLEKISYPAGDVLFAQGDAPEFMCLVYSGRVSVLYRTKEGMELRLRSIKRHTLLGEMGLYQDAPRGASVVIDQPTVVYRLSREALRRMEDEAPNLAIAFHKFVVRTLADRLAFANREVAALQR